MINLRQLIGEHKLANGKLFKIISIMHSVMESTDMIKIKFTCNKDIDVNYIVDIDVSMYTYEKLTPEKILRIVAEDILFHNLS